MDDLAKMAAYQAMDRASSALAYGEPEACVPESTLSGIKSRINRFADNAFQIGHLLSDHADRLHGPAPQSVGANAKESGKPMGALNEIFTALDRLENAQQFLAEQAGRNSNIA